MDNQWISNEYHQVMIQNGQVSDPQETRCQRRNPSSRKEWGADQKHLSSLALFITIISQCWKDHHLLQWQLAPFTMIESWHMPQKAKPRWDYQHVLDIWDKQEYWQGPWKCKPGKSRSRWKPESDPEEAKSGLAVAGSTLAALSTYDSNSRRVKTSYNPYHAQGKGLTNWEINHPKM